jgi:hypothetical protein
MFGQLMKPCADKDLPVIVKSKTRCICGFKHDRYLSSQMGSEGFVNSYTLGFKKRWLCWDMIHCAFVRDCCVQSNQEVYFTFDSALYLFCLYIACFYMGLKLGHFILSKSAQNLGCQLAVATEICRVKPYLCVSSVWTLNHVSFWSLIFRNCY